MLQNIGSFFSIFSPLTGSEFLLAMTPKAQDKKEAHFEVWTFNELLRLKFMHTCRSNRRPFTSDNFVGPGRIVGQQGEMRHAAFRCAILPLLVGTVVTVVDSVAGSVRVITPVVVVTGEQVMRAPQCGHLQGKSSVSFGILRPKFNVNLFWVSVDWEEKSSQSFQIQLPCKSAF